jgi:hypothetical protein
MTASTVPVGVVARWTTRPRPAPGASCEECGVALDAARCSGCGQLAGRPVGMLATLVDSPAGARIIVAQRVAGGWAPISTVPATEDNVRALSRPTATGPAPSSVGALL